MTESDDYHVLITYFGGRFWEGGHFEQASAFGLYQRARTNPKVYKVELLRYNAAQGWQMISFAAKPVTDIVPEGV